MTIHRALLFHYSEFQVSTHHKTNKTVDHDQHTLLYVNNVLHLLNYQQLDKQNHMLDILCNNNIKKINTNQILRGHTTNIMWII